MSLKKDPSGKSQKEQILRWTLRILAEVPKDSKQLTKSDIMETFVGRMHVKQPTFYRVLAQMEKEGLVSVGEVDSIVSLTQTGRERWKAIEWGDGRPSFEEREDYKMIRRSVESKLKGLMEDFQFFARKNAIPYRGTKIVWDLLGYVYEGENNVFRVMAKGADLEHPENSKNIDFLRRKMIEYVESPRNTLIRIQPADTWINWLDFLADLKYNKEEKRDRDNFELYLTEDPPQFITQVNIKNSDEMVLVPMEGLENSYCFHIFDKEIIEGHKTDFGTWLERSRLIDSSKILEVFITNLRKLRELQMHCLIVGEFEKQHIYYSGSDDFSISAKYEATQQLFPADYSSLWDFWFNRWIFGDGKPILMKYCKSTQHEDLGTALAETFPEIHKSGDPVALFGKQSPPAIVRENFRQNPTLIPILKNPDVERGAIELIKYVSTHCIPDVLRKLVKVS